METARSDARSVLYPGAVDGTVESSRSAVSWAAVFAGAFVASATTLILVILGSGLGLSAVSPWHNSGMTAAHLTIAAVVWIIVAQWIAAGVGGYLTGRLRTKWTGTHTHEVFFRDTAHGFLSWAVAAVIGAALLASATSATIGSGAQATATVAAGAAQGAASTVGQPGMVDTKGYQIDTLLREGHPDANAPPAETRAEVTRILAVSAANGTVTPEDRAYLVQVVAARAGIAEADAQKRVDDTIAQAQQDAQKAREAADRARKAASGLAIITALSMVIGAFTACAAAALGGQRRDEHP